MEYRASLIAQSVKNMPATQQIHIRFLSQEDLLEKEMATHFSILAWEIPWTEKPGRQQSLGVTRVRHDLATKPLPTFFSCSFPLWFITGWWLLFPVLYNRPFFLSILYSLLLLIPDSQSFPPLPHMTSLLSLSVNLFLSCRQVHLCCGLDFTYKWYHICLSLSDWFRLVHPCGED